MAEMDDNIDDVRFQHHLEHRGSANVLVFIITWSCIAMFLLVTSGFTIYTRWRRRTTRTHELIQPSSEKSQAWERVWEYLRALSVVPYPRCMGYNLTALPSGNILALVVYSIIVASLLFSVDAPASTAHFADDVAFRAAWVTITQIPLVFFLATKRGPINILSGIPYERLIWIHKWVGRLIFVSATTHMAILSSSISLADVLLSSNRGATVVRYGIGSYSLLCWIALSSVLPIRRWSYRAFYINHWISTMGFLMIIIQHVPRHATIPIYKAFGLMSFDRLLTISGFIKTNYSVRSLQKRLVKFRRAPGRAMLVAGYPVEMHEPYNLSVSAENEDSASTIRICNVPLTWRPGQHIRVYIPALGRFEMHPFTPANCSSIATPPALPPRRSQDVERRGSTISSMPPKQFNDILLMIRPHSGLTRRLKEFHAEWLKLPCPNSTLSSTATSLTAYVDGPYGNPPNWERYENLTLITTSTGVSFALSTMDYLEQLCLSDVLKLRTQVIRFIWIIRHIDPQFEATVAESLRRYSSMLKDSGVRVETELYVTCAHAEIKSSQAEFDQFAHLRHRLPRNGSGDRTLTIRNPDEIYDEWEEEERQWAEMEALEELEMMQGDPFADSDVVSLDLKDDTNITTTYKDEDYASSETSTLLNEAEAQSDERPSRSFSDVRSTVDEATALNGSGQYLPPVRSPLLPRSTNTGKSSCQCALIQHQRQKLSRSGKSPFDSISHGIRPDISYILSAVASDSQHRSSMVAACANDAVSRQVNEAVAGARLAVARGHRQTDIEVFTEGFS